MHDIQQIRSDPEEFDRSLKRLGAEPCAQALIAIDLRRRECIGRSEAAQAERNAASAEAGRAKAGGEAKRFEQLREQISARKSEIAALEKQAEDARRELDEKLLALPNLPYGDVPDGSDESDNREIRRWGEIPAFAFDPREHFEIAGAGRGMDFKRAAKLSGSRFVVLSGAIARIHRALAQFMLDTHVGNGFEEVWTPVIVRGEMMQGTGQLPKFGGESYRLDEGKWLIPTSEVPLANLVSDSILEERRLPLRYCAHTQCFRSEAGAAGRDTAGMLRQHQFEKVEMVSATHPDDSDGEQERMTRWAEALLETLELPYRTVVLCTGDMGFGARRTHDIEVWLPGQGAYREISSVSTCGDFQARRMKARFRPDGGGPPRFVHTLNGSGLAVGRTLIAILENGQREDGSVALPKVLAPRLDGKTVLAATGELVAET